MYEGGEYIALSAPSLSTTTTFYLPNSDGSNGQVLSTDGSGTLSWSSVSSGDNLGNHTATQNISMSGFWLSNDGDNEGVFVNSSGNVGIGTSSISERLEVKWKYRYF